MSNIDKQALREEFQFMRGIYSDPADHERQLIYIAAEALLDELEAKDKRIAELEKSHAQVIQARDHYKRMCEEGFRRINKGINLSINGEG